MTPTKTGMYLRISRDPNGTALGVDRQRVDCEALAERLGWTITRVFTDNDVSASNGRVRPQYEALLTAVASGEVDSIIAWHSDRLHRQPMELERFITLIESHKVAVQTVRAGELDLSTGSGRMIARMLGAAARGETERTQERMRAQKKQARERGDFRGGPRAFGYTADGMEVVEHEAEMLRSAARRLTDGASLRSIVAEWNAQGCKTTFGNDWKPNGVKRAVMRYRNAGKIEHNDEPVADAKWPAIMTMSELMSVRLVLSAPERRRQRSTERAHLGSNLFVCGVSGDLLMSGRNQRGPVYRRYGKGVGGVSRSAPLVDDVVNEVMWRRLADASATAWVREEQRDQAADWATELDSLRQRLSEAAELYAAGAISAAQLGSISTRLQADMTELEGKIASARDVPMLSEVVGSEDVRAAWYELSIDARRKIIDALVTVVIQPSSRGLRWNPDLIEFHWKDDPT